VYAGDRRDLVEQFGNLVPDTPTRERFAERLTGRYIAERKTGCVNPETSEEAIGVNRRRLKTRPAARRRQ
jgi:hypothetical protein